MICLRYVKSREKQKDKKLRLQTMKLFKIFLIFRSLFNVLVSTILSNAQQELLNS